MQRAFRWILTTPVLALQACNPPLPPPAPYVSRTESTSPPQPAPAATAPPIQATAPPIQATAPPIQVERVPLASLGATTCVARGDGPWRCWGHASYGALGSAATIEACGTKAYPSTCARHPVDLAGAKDAAVLAGNDETFCALSRNGRVACWGRQNKGTLGPSPGALDVCTFDGEILPECSPGAKDARCAAARTAPCTTAPQPLPDIVRARSLAAGSGFFCVLLDGGPACWGSNFRGRLGIALEDQEECGHLPKGVFVGGGTGFECSPTPRPVRGLPAIAEIATGGEFGAALSTDGRVFTWGFNSAGQLGRGASAAPAEVPALRGATTLALGHSFACARKGDGTLACWGHHSSGEAGVGKRPADEYGVVRIERPEAVAGLSGVRSVATHSLASHACAVREDGTVACWGANETGQLGTGDRRNRESPTVVPGLQDVERVVVGELYTCAQLRSGEVRCWGANHLGQLGTSRALGMCKLPYVADSSAVPCSLSPVPVKGL